jgi:hypothetical protein
MYSPAEASVRTKKLPFRLLQVRWLEAAGFAGFWKRTNHGRAQERRVCVLSWTRHFLHVILEGTRDVEIGTLPGKYLSSSEFNHPLSCELKLTVTKTSSGFMAVAEIKGCATEMILWSRLSLGCPFVKFIKLSLIKLAL